MKTKWLSLVLASSLTLTALLSPCHAETAGLGLNAESKPATSYTIDANQEVYRILDFSDVREFDNAQKGFIAAPEVLEIYNDSGKLVWSQNYSFLKEDAPDTANPSLWRDTQLNNIYGLFEVTNGIYQVRGYDMSNVTFIEGETGWIVVDPLMSVECAKAALQLVRDNLGDRPIHAVIYSHSHVDHFGGVRGVINEEDVLAGKVQVIAPEGFEEHAISENIYAGS
ncbi:MAG: MBL fold metallo-hydrolase, partial [Clostridia bacterium]|nr:MBL fold metallo-hydrolase [Clostridia bacterium]